MYNTFSMLIELINCNKINVSLHFAHFCLPHIYVCNCKTVSSFSTLPCCAVSFARTLINSLHALYTFGIVIQIGTQGCDNDAPPRDIITCFTWVPVAQIPAWYTALLSCCWSASCVGGMMSIFLFLRQTTPLLHYQQKWGTCITIHNNYHAVTQYSQNTQSWNPNARIGELPKT